MGLKQQGNEQRIKEQQHPGAFTFIAFAVLHFKRKNFRGIILQQARNSHNLTKISDNFLLRIQKWHKVDKSPYKQSRKERIHLKNISGLSVS